MRSYVLGVGAVVGGGAEESYGGRLEGACLSLLLVRPPHPLPEVGDVISNNGGGGGGEGGR